MTLRPPLILITLFAAPLLSGCAVVVGAAAVTSTAVSVAATGVSVGASATKAVVSTGADVVTYPFKDKADKAKE